MGCNKITTDLRAFISLKPVLVFKGAKIFDYSALTKWTLLTCVDLKHLIKMFYAAHLFR